MNTNTCIYKGNTFTMQDVQICSVMNKGYILPGQTGEPVAELIISYSPNISAESLNNLSGILLCVPIYDSGVPNHNEYITRLIDPDGTVSNTALVPTLESIFYGWDGDTTQTSLAYKTTFNTVDNNNKLSFHSLYVVVFPTGIRLSSAMYQQLLLKIRNTDNSIGNTLPAYRVPLGIRNFNNTVTTFYYDSTGNKVDF